MFKIIQIEIPRKCRRVILSFLFMKTRFKGVVTRLIKKLKDSDSSSITKLYKSFISEDVIYTSEREFINFKF